MNKIDDKVKLANGYEMPWLGLGVFLANEGKEVISAIKYALGIGYRHIDTAAIYRNEPGVGSAVKSSGIKREEIFVTTKLWNSSQGYDSTLKAFDKSLNRLEMDYIDLYLIHWPVVGKYKETWKAFERLYDEGSIKSIGVSNFMTHHLENLMVSCNIAPMVNQIEFHPYLQQLDLWKFCKENNIRHEAWRPILKGQANDVKELSEIGSKYDKSGIQVALRWNLQMGAVTIPKSVNPERIKHNSEIFDFELKEEDMNIIKRLDKNHRFGPDPDNFNF